MKKQLCITTFAFGEDYQDYIPFYIYSILKSYPGYYPFVFVHSKLRLSIQKQLQHLSQMGEFKVVDEYWGELKLKGQRAKFIRYLLYHSEFTEYQAVYIGDIDMFILPENPPLFEQHWEHCSTIGLVYSNIVREQTEYMLSIANIKNRLSESGILSTLLSLTRSKMIINKLSGLHFVKSKEYFSKLLPLFPKYKKLIIDNSYESIKSTIHHKAGFNNECLLYDMIRESGLGLPPKGPYGPFMIDYKNFRSPWFRPHHGIHLGIFRQNYIAPDSQKILSLDCYNEYYKKFCRMTKNDPIFQRLMEDTSENIKSIFHRIHQYYERI